MKASMAVFSSPTWTKRPAITCGWLLGGVASVTSMMNCLPRALCPRRSANGANAPTAGVAVLQSTAASSLQRDRSHPAAAFPTGGTPLASPGLQADEIKPLRLGPHPTYHTHSQSQGRPAFHFPLLSSLLRVLFSPPLFSAGDRNGCPKSVPCDSECVFYRET
ncbi:hypothetical protein D9C73_003326 [Collichthys lucidus]|uniref:Uncharacterized protein n=1 Tax=Collichthys lucidus TaxID=240159 RepID=A0A4V6AMN0_COLLU|nr:hypothetical protein D9C73_003326 [Collichthys lucidus]